MSPAVHALDRRLQWLRSAHDAKAASLADLEADGTYRLLADHPVLSGTTALTARPVLGSMDEVHQGLHMLDELLEWASSLRTSRQMSEHRAIRLLQLLDGPCIVLAADTLPKMTPETLLGTIDDALRRVRDVVAEVDAAWRDFRPRLARVAGDADRLAREEPGLPSVVAERATLGSLPHRVVDDPLGAIEELRRIEAVVAAAADARAEAARRLCESLATAAETVVELAALVDEGRDGLARSRAEITEPRGLLDPVDPVVLGGERGLRPWLARLQRLVAEGETALAAKGLESWWGMAEPTLTTARAVAAANVLPVRRRQELTGLLGAARVKAGTAGRAEDPRVAELADRADRALAPPCDLAAAEARVHDYLDELRRRPAAAPPRWQEVTV